VNIGCAAARRRGHVCPPGEGGVQRPGDAGWSRAVDAYNAADRGAPCSPASGGSHAGSSASEKELPPGLRHPRTGPNCRGIRAGLTDLDGRLPSGRATIGSGIGGCSAAEISPGGQRRRAGTTAVEEQLGGRGSTRAVSGGGAFRVRMRTDSQRGGTRVVVRPTQRSVRSSGSGWACVRGPGRRNGPAIQPERD